MTKVSSSTPSPPPEKPSEPENNSGKPEGRVEIHGDRVRFIPETVTREAAKPLAARTPAKAEGQLTAGLTRDQSRGSSTNRPDSALHVSATGASEVPVQSSPAWNKALRQKAEILETVVQLESATKNKPGLCGAVNDQILAYSRYLERSGTPAEACKSVMSLREKILEQTENMPHQHKGVLKRTNNDNRRFLLETAASLGRLAIKQMPPDSLIAVRHSLDSERASDRVSGLMFLSRDVERNATVFASGEDQQAFQDLCQELALTDMLSPHESFGNLTATDEGVQASRDATQVEYDKETTALKAYCREKGTVAIPKQTHKDMLRQHVILQNDGVIVFDNAPIRERGDRAISDSQKEESARQVDGKVLQFLTGLGVPQQIAVLSHLNQIEFLDMNFTFQDAQKRHMKGWGVFQMGNHNKSIDVQRSGNEVRLKYTVEAEPTLMSEIAGQGLVVAYDQGSLLKLEREVIFQPDQPPKYGELQVALHLAEGYIKN